MAQLDVQYIRYSTDGSAARQYWPVFPKTHTTTVTKTHRHSRTRIYVDPVAILGIAVAACMLIMMVVGVFQLKNAQQKAVQMERYVSQLSAQSKALENQYEAGYDLKEVEQTARALGMIPVAEASQYSVSVFVPQAEEEQTFWDRIGTFLTGLFA